MKLTRDKILKIEQDGWHSPHIKGGPLFSIFNVKLDQIESVTGLTKKEFQHREAIRVKKSKTGNEIKVVPTWIPIYKNDTHSERGRGASWRFAFPDLMLLYIMNQLRDTKTGLQKALCSFFKYHGLYCVKNRSTFSPLSDNFSDHKKRGKRNQFNLIISGFPLEKAYEVKSSTPSHGYESKKTKFKILYQIKILMDGKPCAAWTYLVHDDKYYVPTYNEDDVEKCQLNKISSLQTENGCMEINIDLNKANNGVYQNIQNVI